MKTEMCNLILGFNVETYLVFLRIIFRDKIKKKESKFNFMKLI